MSELTLEIVEGPGAGVQVALAGPVVIGRASDADIVLADEQASRHHARVTPNGDVATVEDLDSSNGTYVNGHEVSVPARLDPGDDLLIGISVLELRTANQVVAQPSAVRAVPAALAAAVPFPPSQPAAPKAELGPVQLQRLRDSRVSAQTQLAPLAVTALVAIVLIAYFLTR